MLVAKCDDYILRNCELALVDGNDLYVIFHAGNLGNNYLVLTVSDISCFITIIFLFKIYSNMCCLIDCQQYYIYLCVGH